MTMIVKKDPLLEAMRAEGWDTDEQDRVEYSRNPRDPEDNVHKLKTKAETKRIDIQNAVALHHLISRKLTTAMLETIGQEMRTSFIDMPRRVSPHMAAMAGNPGIEREFEKFLAGFVQVGIENVKAKVQEMCEDAFFENILDEI